MYLGWKLRVRFCARAKEIRARAGRFAREQGDSRSRIILIYFRATKMRSTFGSKITPYMSVHNDVCGSATLWKLYGASNNLVQELRLDDARFHTTPRAPKLVRSVAIFSFILLLWTRLSTRLSSVSCQKGAWRKAFFSKKLNFFHLEKTLWAAEKDAGAGVLKSAQDCFENMVYSTGL